MAFEHELFGTEAWSAAGYRAEVSDTRNRYYVAVEDDTGALLGWGGVLVAADQAEILTVGVVPAAQRRGLARRMLAALSEEAHRRGARELFLEVRVDNAPAIALYESEGFTRIGHRRGYYDHGRVDALTMRKALP
jgi:ribosomal-protein-alanine N-acetyltransferase